MIRGIRRMFPLQNIGQKLSRMKFSNLSCLYTAYQKPTYGPMSPHTVIDWLVFGLPNQIQSGQLLNPCTFVIRYIYSIYFLYVTFVSQSWKVSNFLFSIVYLCPNMRFVCHFTVVSGYRMSTIEDP